MNNYQQHKQQVLQLFQQAIVAAKYYQAETTIKHLETARQNLILGKLFVVVAGEFKQGKSSLLNALLNETEIFPVDIDITTNLVSTITYGKQEKVRVVLGESGKETIKQIAKSEIPDYVTEQRNLKNAKQAKMLTIESPNSQLKEGLVLVDTPGIGSLNAEHTAVTHAFLPNADVVLFVSDALKPLTTEELDFLKERILPHCQNLIFVLTKADLVSDVSEIVANNREKLTKVLGCDPHQIKIIPVSSRAKFDYLEYEEEEDLAYSNFYSLEREIWQMVGEQRGQTLLLRAINELMQSVAELKAPVEVAWKSDRNQTSEDLETKLKQTRQQLKKLLYNNAEWRNILSDRLQSIQFEIQGQFKRDFAQLRYKTNKYIEDDRLVNSPKQIANLIEADVDGLMSQLNQDLNQQAGELYGYLEAETGLDISRLEVGFSQRQQAVLLSEEIEIDRSTIIDKSFTTTRNAMFNTSVGTAIGGMIGGAVGGAIGLVFGAGVGVVPGATIGGQIGAGIGWIGGGAKGIKDGLEQVKEKDKAIAKREISKIVSPFIDECQRICNQTLTKAIQTLERDLRDKFTAQVKRQKEGWENTLRSLQESQKLSQGETAKRSQQLQLSLKKFSQLQQMIQTVAAKVVVKPQQSKTPIEINQSPAKNTPPKALAAVASSNSNSTDYGDWADESD